MLRDAGGDRGQLKLSTARREFLIGTVHSWEKRGGVTPSRRKHLHYVRVDEGKGCGAAHAQEKCSVCK